jgi:hypothetical protein
VRAREAHEEGELVDTLLDEFDLTPAAPPDWWHIAERGAA